MSSPGAFRDSSPAGAPGRRRSRFTYRQLHQLASYSTSCPLRVVAHIDLDSFYAQCEMIRLGTKEDQPVAVQQWQGLIAVNYSAREFGIGRMCTVDEAKKLCPDLIAQHVATWREGDEKWAYHEDAAANIATHKVSLDPYRLESRKIISLIKESLPSDLQKVEKAGIDEVFLDLSAQVHSLLLERFPELARPPPYDDPTEKLPLPSVSALDWQADALVDLDDTESEVDDPDWDDVAILLGSQVVRGIRATIREKLHYTCSGGIAQNKMLSKLGSGFKKPNRQTVIRNRAVGQFLSTFKFTKIRNLGGKLGDQVAQIYGTEMVSGLLATPMEQLKSKLGDDTGVWVYNTIRGIDYSEINSRTQIKSMLSAKSFRPSINTLEQAEKWLRIFAADIFSRLVEEGVLENKRRPKTINLYHRHGGQTRSRSSPIPSGKLLEERTLFELAKHLLSQIVLEGKVWPCANLSLSVAGFEDGVTGNMGIGAFLVKGEAAQALRASPRSEGGPDADGKPPEKKRRTGDANIQRFFSRADSASLESTQPSILQQVSDEAPTPSHLDEPWREAFVGSEQVTDANAPYTCRRCYHPCDDAEAYQSHQDWHFAKDLQEEENERERGRSGFAAARAPSAQGASGASSRGPLHKQAAASSKKTSRSKPVEAGQSRLKFG